MTSETLTTTAPEYRLKPLPNGRFALFRKLPYTDADNKPVYEHLIDCTGIPHAQRIIEQLKKPYIYLDADGNVVEEGGAA